MTTKEEIESLKQRVLELEKQKIVVVEKIVYLPQSYPVYLPPQYPSYWYNQPYCGTVYIGNAQGGVLTFNVY